MKIKIANTLVEFMPLPLSMTEWKGFTLTTFLVVHPALDGSFQVCKICKVSPSWIATCNARINCFFLGNLLLKSDTKENFRGRFPILEWMKLLKCSQILRWYYFIFGWMYLIWMNKCYSIYLQHGSFKSMDVNSYVTPLKIATWSA